MCTDMSVSCCCYQYNVKMSLEFSSFFNFFLQMWITFIYNTSRMRARTANPNTMHKIMCTAFMVQNFYLTAKITSINNLLVRLCSFRWPWSPCPRLGAFRDTFYNEFWRKWYQRKGRVCFRCTPNFSSLD